MWMLWLPAEGTAMLTGVLDVGPLFVQLQLLRVFTFSTGWLAATPLIPTLTSASSAVSAKPRSQT